MLQVHYLNGNTVKLAIDSLYGSKELGFADADNLTLTTGW